MIKIRSMTMEEFDAYQDLVETNVAKDIPMDKVSRMAAIWVLKEIYKIDMYDKKCATNPGTMLNVCKQTIDATMQADESVIESIKKSGNGDAKEE